MRLIDADAYAADLWKLRANYQMLDDTHTADKIMHGIFRAEQVLKEQPTIAASPWHRVEEKPKEADQYFVIWENNGDRGGGAAWFSLRLGWIWGGPKITHWMPIELPKEEGR